jgi:hypothetical protein
MLGQPFSLAHLRDTGEALYGSRWQPATARDLKVPLPSVRKWCDGALLPDIRGQLADICRRYAAHDSKLSKLAPKLEKLGPPVLYAKEERQARSATREMIRKKERTTTGRPTPPN